MTRGRSGPTRLFRPGTWSVSMRLALWYGASILVLLTGFSVISYITFHRSLHRDFDQHLEHELRVLLPLVDFSQAEPRFTQFEAMRSVAYQTDGIYGTYVRLLDVSGRVLYRSPNLEGHAPLPVELPSEPVERVQARDWQDGPIRSHYHPLFNADETLVGWLEVSGFEWSLHQELERLVQVFLLGILLSFAAALGGGYLLARRSLRPVARITRVANEIQANRLDQRIPTDEGVRDELTRLTETINELLDRIQASFQRERRFSTNAAHELITPLATIRGELELALRGSQLPQELVPRMKAALDDTDRMNRIIRSLLQLSSAERLDRKSMVSLDVAPLVRDRVERFRDRAAVEKKRLASDLSPGCVARVDREEFGRVVENLVDNSLKYSETGGRVDIQLFRVNGEVLLVVKDDGIGFEPGAADHLFDRFFRADTVEVRRRSGSGLGLAIVSAIVQAHGGRVHAESRGPGEGAAFEVRVPAV